MNIVYYISDFFSEICCTSMCSLMENNKKAEEINFYIVENALSAINKNRLTECCNFYGRNIFFIKMPLQSEVYPNVKMNLGRTYARMALGKILPDLDRVLSLDSDTLILDDISELYNVDFKENEFVAGVYDCVGRAHQLKIMNAKSDLDYCNAGMFLVDLKKWRQNNIDDKFINVLEGKIKNKECLYFLEQDLMNIVFDQHIKIVHPRYNLLTSIAYFKYKETIKMKRPCKYYSENEVNEAKNKPAIIHATTCFYIKKRMWVEKSDHPFSKQYQFYRNLTPWKNDKMIMDGRKRKKKIFGCIWHMIPRCVAVVFASFLINFIRPRYAKFTSKHQIDTIAIQSNT